VVALDSDPLTLDPANATDLASARVVSQIYDTLVTTRADGSTVEPGLAQSWSVSPDGREWTFTLRRNVAFHDGTPLTADAVAENVRRWMDPAHPAHRGDFDYWRLLFRGFAGRGSLVRRVDRVDELRLRIVLDEPHGPFLRNLALYPFAIVSPLTLRDHPTAVGAYPSGTGAFQFTRRLTDTIELIPIPGYWGGAPRVGRLVFRIIPDKDKRVSELGNDAVHIVFGDVGDSSQTVYTVPGVQVIWRPAQVLAFLTFNQKQRPLDDPRVRLAIAQAINRTLLIERFYGEGGQVASQFVLPGYLGYDHDVKGPIYDPAQARQLLREAGLANGFGIQLWYPPRARPFLLQPKAVANSIAGDLAAINISADVRTTDWQTFQYQLTEGRYPLVLFGWAAETPDPDNILSNLFLTDTAARTTGYANQDVRNLLTRARLIFDDNPRADLYRQVNRRLQTDLPRFPLVTVRSPVFLSHRVQGFIAGPLGVDRLFSVSLTP